jgi:two-component system sensor histidine kinase PhoQ
MQDIVAHQLSRAVRQQVNASAIAAAPCVQRIVSALQKVHARKSITVEQYLDMNALVRVDERDLMEVLGNVIDNAFKHAQQHIRIRVQIERELLVVSVEDDGKGIPPEQTELILQRGQRLDTLQVGQGIGLAVVVDIVESYKGAVKLGHSDLGGLLLQLSLPQ